MRNYFKRLKQHPGLEVATWFTILMFLGAASNKNIRSIEGVFILGGIGSVLIWSIVLITNFRKREQLPEQKVIKNLKQKMDIREKVLLLDLLMWDINTSWDTNKNKIFKDSRIWKCLDLIDEFRKIANNNNHKHYELLAGINWFNFYQSIGIYLTGRYEGSYFKMSICNGGYEGLELIHRLKPDFPLRSVEFYETLQQHYRSESLFIIEFKKHKIIGK